MTRSPMPTHVAGKPAGVKIVKEPEHRLLQNAPHPSARHGMTAGLRCWR
jgi:hypothetical protein